MKIYTFNAPVDTRVELLWSLRSKNRDKIFDSFIHQNKYTEVNSIQDCDLAIYPNRVFHPETLNFDRSVFTAAKKAEQYNKPLVIDATSDSDVFLNIPTAKILRCGLYKSLQQPFEIECPFWSNYRTKKSLDALIALPKKSKPAIGFCGTISSIGKLSQLGKLMLPSKVAKVVLAKGKLACKFDIRLRESMSLKLRTLAINILSLDTRIESHFDISDPHQSYYLKNETNQQLLENLFVTNTGKCDYVLCIRGTGNYSGRFYMALNAGRIPVVLDTDIVIPFEDKLQIVKVPVQSLENIGDFVLEHFEQTTDKELNAMKAQNRFVYNQFISPERFFPNLLYNMTKGRIQVPPTA